LPTYEYECQRCGHRFELFQSMSDEPRKRCPECRGKLRRLLGAGAGIIFKGSGFYATDYRKPQKPAASDGGSSGDGEKSGTKEKPAGGEAGPKKEKGKAE
jgi:putative FmdB family regulatory protein